jgi:hypothetical protein
MASSEPTAIAKTDAGLTLTVSTPEGEKTVVADGISLAATVAVPT